MVRRPVGLVVAGVVGVLFLAGCGSAPPVEPPPAPVVQAPSSCDVEPAPETGPVRSQTIVDYVDFVRWGGREYVSAGPPYEDVSLGPVVAVSRCSFRELNDRTGQMTPTPVDGDTGFLPAGTPILAVVGWAPECRLAARLDGAVHVYLAQQPGTEYATPAACAL
jgi:hypothetical protein